MDLGYYWKIFRRRLPYVIILAALGTAIGVSLAMTLPPTYNSEATLIVESEQIPGDLAETTVRTGEVEALQIIRQRILSRDVLLELANELEIYPPESELTADQKVDEIREDLNPHPAGQKELNAGKKGMEDLTGVQHKARSRMTLRDFLSRSSMSNLVQSPIWNAFFGGLILANTVMMATEFHSLGSLRMSDAHQQANKYANLVFVVAFVFVSVSVSVCL